MYSSKVPWQLKKIVPLTRSNTYTHTLTLTTHTHTLTPAPTYTHTHSLSHTHISLSLALHTASLSLSLFRLSFSQKDTLSFSLKHISTNTVIYPHTKTSIVTDLLSSNEKKKHFKNEKTNFGHNRLLSLSKASPGCGTLFLDPTKKFLSSNAFLDQLVY